MVATRALAHPGNIKIKININDGLGLVGVVPPLLDVLNMEQFRRKQALLCLSQTPNLVNHPANGGRPSWENL